MKLITNSIVIYFYLCLTLTLAAHPSRIDLTQYPISVSAPNPILSHETALLCDEYISFLKDSFHIKSFPHPLRPLLIYIHPKPSSPQLSQLEYRNTIQIDKTNPDWKIILTEHLTTYFFKNMLVDKDLSNSNFTLPYFIISGFTTKYWDQKIEDSFINTYFAIQNNIYIPFNIILTATKKFDPPLDSFFDIQSVMIIERLLTIPTPLTHISSFVKTFRTTQENAVSTLIHTLGFQSLTILHTTFINHISAQPIIINTLTEKKEISPKTIKELLQIILTFSFTDPASERNTSVFTVDNIPTSRIIVKADDIKIYDLPYIPTSQIDGKIITLRMLQDTCTEPWYTRITHYIKAFTFLKQGNFEQYYDNLYRATK